MLMAVCCLLCRGRSALEHRLAMLGVIFQTLWERKGTSKASNLVSPLIRYFFQSLGQLSAHG